MVMTRGQVMTEACKAFWKNCLAAAIGLCAIGVRVILEDYPRAMRTRWTRFSAA